MLGPIFPVEMVTSGRRARFILVRALYGLILLLIIWGVYAESSFFTSGTPTIEEVARLATMFFIAFSWIQLIGLLLVAPAMAAGSIAVERERRTIEYLFATDLSNLELILGKLVARLLQMACFVLVGLPILAILRLMGGIPNELLLAVFAITLSTMVLVAVLGVCISVWSPRARDAVSRTYLVLVAGLGLPLVLNLIFMANPPVRANFLSEIYWLIMRGNDLLLSINPLYALGMFWLTPGAAGQSINWPQIGYLVAGQMGLAAFCIAISIFAVRRVHLSASGKPSKVKDKGPRGQFGILPRPQLGDRPMMWKELFARHSIQKLGILGRVALVLILLMIVGITLWWFISALFDPDDWEVEQYMGFATFMGSLTACLALLRVGAQAASAITSERERDCWDSILSTPLTAKEIVHAKIAGSMWSARGVFLLLAFIWGLGVLLRPSHLIAVMFHVVTFVICLFFVSSLGVIYSLRLKSSMRAMGATLGTLLFVGGGYFITCCFPLMVASGPGDEGLMLILAPCIPFLLSLPTMASEFFFQGSSGLHDEEVMLLFAYCAGNVGYLIAATVLTASASANFNRITGRSGAEEMTEQIYRHRHELPSPEQYIVPEIIDEEGSGEEES